MNNNVQLLCGIQQSTAQFPIGLFAANIFNLNVKSNEYLNVETNCNINLPIVFIQLCCFIWPEIIKKNDSFSAHEIGFTENYWYFA